MCVTFILGRAASNREEYMIDAMRKIIKDDATAPILVIVPPQATYSTECMIMEGLGVAGIMGIDVVSISRIALRIQQEVYGIRQQGIGAAGKSMLIQKILRENSAQLKTLGKMQARHAILPLINDVITECKQLCITPQMLREFESTNLQLADKFQDFALIYEQLQVEMQDFLDTEDKLALVTEHVKNAEFIRNAYVFIHGFDMYNEQTVRFLTEVMRTARHTTMSFLHAEENAPDAAVYGICNENQMRFNKAAKELGLEKETITQDKAISRDILHVRDNLFAFHAKDKKDVGDVVARDVHVHHACDMREEVDGVAAQIAILTQKQGYRFSDIAVACANAESYLPLVKKRFDKVGIPCYTGQSRGLLESNLADFVLSTFELMGGRLKMDVLLKHAFCGYSGLEREEVAILQNYVYEHVRDGFAFQKEFDGDAEPARKKLMQPIEQLRARAKKAKAVRELIRCAWQYFEQIELKGKVARAAQQMREEQRQQSADYTEQAYERLMDVLRQMEQLSGQSDVDAAKLAGVLRTGMAAEGINTIPPAAEEVFCCDVSGTYLPEIKLLFVLGANEGALPNYSHATDLLTEREREEMLREIAKLQHTGSMDKEKLAIIKAFSRPSDGLYISYVKDGSRQKSPLIDRLCNLFKNLEESPIRQFVPALAQNAVGVTLERMGKAAKGFDLDQDTDAAVSAALHSEQCKDTLQRAEQYITTANQAKEIGGFAKTLYGSFAASATRVESYYACPYKHFVEYGIRPRVLQECTVNPMDVGQYAHFALDGIAKKMKAEQLAWNTVEDRVLNEVVEAALADVRREQPKYHMNKQNQAVLDAVERDVKMVTHMIRKQCGQGELQPYQSEYKFDIDGIRGVVDRIDVAQLEAQNYFSIVDYKTSAHDFDLNRLFYGVGLQLVIYVMAVQELLGEEYTFAGANYMRIYNAMRKSGEPLEPLYQMCGIEGVPADVAKKLYGVTDNNKLYAVKGSIKKDGEYEARTEQRHYPQQMMQTVARYVKMLIEDMKRRSMQGENEIRPLNDTKTGAACDLCNFSGVCMFDRQEEESRMVQVKRKKRDEVIQLMQNKVEEA